MKLSITVPDTLHPATAVLVQDFATALAAKLDRAARKYGYTDGWRTHEWRQDCFIQFQEHIQKGDPIDVAAYCAFMWARGWPCSGDH